MNKEDFQTVFLRMKDKLFRVALRIVTDRAIADDVVQEVLIKLWKNQEKIKTIQNVDGWLMVMTRNLSIDKIRSKHHKTNSLDSALFLKDGNVEPDIQTEYQDLINTIGKTLEVLPLKQKLAFQLRDIEGMSYQEISDSLEISLSDVKVNLHRARKKIKEQLILVESYGLQ